MEEAKVDLYPIEFSPTPGESKNQPGRIPGRNVDSQIVGTVWLAISSSETDGFMPALRIVSEGNQAVVPFFGPGIPEDKLPTDAAIRVSDFRKHSSEEIMNAVCSSYAGLLAQHSKVSIDGTTVVLDIKGAIFRGTARGHLQLATPSAAA